MADAEDAPVPQFLPPEEPPPVAGIKRPVVDERKTSAKMKDKAGNTVVRSRSPPRSPSANQDCELEAQNPTWAYRLKKFKVAFDVLVRRLSSVFRDCFNLLLFTV